MGVLPKTKCHVRRESCGVVSFSLGWDERRQRHTRDETTERNKEERERETTGGAAPPPMIPGRQALNML